MIIIDNEDRAFIKKYAQKVKDTAEDFNKPYIEDMIPSYINIDSLIDNGQGAADTDKLLDILDCIINLEGFAPPDYEDYNDFGREAQAVYDRIYANN